MSREPEVQGSQGVPNSDKPSPVPRVDAKSAAGPAPEPPVARPQAAPNVPTGSDLAPPEGVADADAKIAALKRESLAVVNRLLEDFPGNVDALGIAGNVHKYYGNGGQASKCWEEGLRRDPSRVDFYDALAKLALTRAEDEKAAQWCRQGLAQNVNAPHLHGRLGEALTALGRLEEAVPELERETQISPTSAAGHFSLGQAYTQLHEYQKAKTCHETAVELNAKESKYEPRYVAALANACAKLGLDEEARRYNALVKQLRDAAPPYDDLLEVQRRAAKTCGDAAAVYRTQRKVAKAEELWARSAVLDAKDQGCRLELIAIFAETGRDSKAAELCKELIELEPNNAVHQVELGFFYARMRQFEAARKASQRALELAPDNPLCKQFYEQMQRAPK